MSSQLDSSGVPQGSTRPKSWLALVLLALGLGALRQSRNERNAGFAHGAVPKVTEVTWFRICTEQSDAEPEPVKRSGTDNMSVWSELSDETVLNESTEIFRMQTPLPTSDTKRAGEIAHQAPEIENIVGNSDRSPRKTPRALTLQRNADHTKLKKVASFGSMEFIGAPKDRIRDVARQLSQNA